MKGMNKRKEGKNDQRMRVSLMRDAQALDIFNKEL